MAELDGAVAVKDLVEHEHNIPCSTNEGITEVTPIGVQTGEEKHPLENLWTLWYSSRARNENWEASLNRVSSFDTVEDFWGLFNHIEVSSRLPDCSQYFVFKDGVKPAWEDPQNANGGRWILRLLSEDRVERLDQCWIDLLMIMVGNQFDEENDHICGAVVFVSAKFGGHRKRQRGVLRVDFPESIPPVSSLPMNYAYYLFREGIKPMWEDANNINGGRYSFLSRYSNLDRNSIDVLSAILEQRFGEYHREICGVTVKRATISLWNRNRNNEVAVTEIHRILATILRVPTADIRYESHPVLYTLDNESTK